MSKYNFDTWLNSQIDLDLTEIINNGFDASSDAELIARGFRQEEQGISREECGKFSIRVKTFMTLLKFGQKSLHVLECDWESFKPFCLRLVEKNQMDKEILGLF